ncbi:MAG: hypothetical protein OEZ48_13505 [Candidatus Bathyarchaeota archaeon]|nr:hypothetical protein [Candidatus Bathyarchaeota archaeon]MDH5688863.1 hypothetical protein [Candidatus Bathyarchaeota archaeon]
MRIVTISFCQLASYTIVREASNFVYSWLRGRDDQTQAKTQTIYMLNPRPQMALQRL